MIQVYCKNTGTSKAFEEGVYLTDVLGEFEFDRPYRIVSAKVNNVSQGLRYRVYNSKDVEFLDLRDSSAMRVYFRSLSFLLCKAARDMFAGSKIYIEHEISGGYYVNFLKPDGSRVSEGDVAAIKGRMQELVSMDIPFHRFEVKLEDAVKIFRDRGYEDKVKLLETSGQVYSDYYTLDGEPDYYYGRLLPGTSYFGQWDLRPFHHGMILMLPDRHDPDRLAPFVDQPKTFGMFSENLRWNIIMRLNNVGDVNLACLKGHASELIQVAEALQDKKIVQIAEEIDRRFRSADPVKLVLITGPSSSGKTTFCRRLSVQLMACGLRPVSFSTDDYFVNREDTPRLPGGQYDFDNFDTVDHRALQDDLVRLLDGEEVSLPEYNFTTGKREYKGKRVRLGASSVVLVEGIHALNPALTDRIPEERKFRVFINTLTCTSLDNHNAIPTSDNRLLRRIVRDWRKGAFTPRETISQWPSVLDAEDKWIYPFQENADMMFNSAYLIEFAVLRNHAEPILAGIPKNSPEYSEAHRLLKFIHYFIPVPDREIPSTSLLRDFIGGSSFSG